MTGNNNSGINGGPSAAFYTLGCRVNQYETQSMEEQFRNAGFTIRSFDEECDVYVINTCTVTAESDRKSRQIIRRTAGVKKPTSIVIVCGCYSQGDPDDIAAIDGVDIILGNTRKSDICRLAREYLEEKKERVLVEDIMSVSQYEDSYITSSDRTRAFVKIVDGCENHCSYCIIPSVRGKIRSRSKEDILSEISRLADNGYKEVVLTGIETAAYGKDFKKSDTSPLSELIREVASVEKIERIRLGSMEPTVFTEELVKELAAVPKLMPHYHLSLQSGSDTVLRFMKRKYNTSQFLTITERLRRYIPNVQLTTDIIVGFPGETQELFDETVEFAKKCGFSFIHIFPYSKRKGTPAAVMAGQIEKTVKKERVTRLESVMKDIRSDILAEFIGRHTKVLLETQTEGYIDGYTPEYIKVKIPHSENQGSLSGIIKNVVITGTDIDDDGSKCLSGIFQ